MPAVQYSSGLGEVAVAPGLGSVTLTAAISSAFARLSTVFANGDNFTYALRDQRGGKWEIGIGKFTTGDIIVREFVLASNDSNSGFVNFTVPVHLFVIGHSTATPASSAALY